MEDAGLLVMVEVFLQYCRLPRWLTLSLFSQVGEEVREMDAGAVVFF